MRLLKFLKLHGVMRMLNALVVIGIYKFWGIDIVILYSVLNIDAHLDEIADSINKIIIKQEPPTKD